MALALEQWEGLPGAYAPSPAQQAAMSLAAPPGWVGGGGGRQRGLAGRAGDETLETTLGGALLQACPCC